LLYPHVVFPLSESESSFLLFERILNRLDQGSTLVASFSPITSLKAHLQVPCHPKVLVSLVLQWAYTQDFRVRIEEEGTVQPVTPGK
jgi:hypothetical protein